MSKTLANFERPSTTGRLVVGEQARAWEGVSI